MNRTLRGLVVIGIVGIFAMVLSQQQESGFTCSPNRQVVKSGDTIYHIVRRNCTGDTQKVTDSVVDTYGSGIYVGQVIYLPTTEKCGVIPNETKETQRGC